MRTRVNETMKKYTSYKETLSDIVKEESSDFQEVLMGELSDFFKDKVEEDNFEALENFYYLPPYGYLSEDEYEEVLEELAEMDECNDDDDDDSYTQQEHKVLLEKNVWLYNYNYALKTLLKSYNDVLKFDELDNSEKEDVLIEMSVALNILKDDVKFVSITEQGNHTLNLEQILQLLDIGDNEFVRTQISFGLDYISKLVKSKEKLGAGLVVYTISSGLGVAITGAFTKDDLIEILDNVIAVL